MGMFQGFHAFMQVFLALLNAGSRYSHEKEKMSHLPTHLVNGGGREFDTFPNEKQRISRMNAYIFLSNLLFLYIGFFGFLCYNGIEVKKIEGQYIKIKKR